MTIFQLLLGAHITGGGAGLLSGTIILFLRKGDSRHKTLGKVFYWSMNLASVAALILSRLHPNDFLFIVGIFTLYMNLTGKAYLRFKQPGSTFSRFELVVLTSMALAALYFIINGILLVTNTSSFGWVYITFGFISIGFLFNDFNFLKGKSKIKNQWLLSHLQRMLGTYIASVTAFLVVNIHFQPGFVVWLLPTAVITPLIFYWSKKFASKPLKAN